MLSKRLWFLLALLAGLTFCQPAEAQKSWPVDTSGVPAPPCVTYDPTANTIAYCPPTGAATPANAGANSVAFGGGFFTGPDTGSALVGSQMDCMFQDEINVVCVGGRNVGAFNLFRSTDGGTTIKFVQQSTAGAQNSFMKFVKSASGLYVAGVNDNPQSIQTSLNLNVFTRAAGNGLAGTAANTIPYVAGNTFLLTEDGGNTICRNTANASGTALSGAWVCVAPPSWTGALSTAPNIGKQEIAASTGAGSGSGIWIALDKATPSNVIRSTNDGVSWSALTTLAAGTASGTPSRAIVCLSNLPSVCLAGVDGAIYRSSDSGATWTQVTLTTSAGMTKGFLDYHNGTIVAVGNGLGTPAATPGCLPDCGRISNIVWAKSADFGLTWSLITGGLTQQGGVGSDGLTALATSPTSGRAVITDQRVNQACPGSFAGSNCYVYGPTIPPSNVAVVGSGALLQRVLDHGEQVMAGPVQAGLLFNTQTTSAVNTAVSTTITGIIGYRVHVYKVAARCSAGTSNITITDAGTTTFTTAAADVTAAINHIDTWSPGYTGGDGATVVITLATCGAGNTGTLSVQADQY